MRSLLALLICICVSLSYTGDAFAQEMEAKKMEGHSWHQVAFVKFKAGMADSAMKIIDNHFMKAGMAMESDAEGPKIMRFRSGEWDIMMLWPMKGIEDLEWEVSPEDVEWWQKMVEQEGGEEKASKLMKNYMDMVANSTTYLATSQMPETEEETMGAATDSSDVN